MDSNTIPASSVPVEIVPRVGSFGNVAPDSVVGEKQPNNDNSDLPLDEDVPMIGQIGAPVAGNSGDSATGTSDSNNTVSCHLQMVFKVYNRRPKLVLFRTKHSNSKNIKKGFCILVLVIVIQRFINNKKHVNCLQCENRLQNANATPHHIPPETADTPEANLRTRTISGISNNQANNNSMAKKNKRRRRKPSKANRRKTVAAAVAAASAIGNGSWRCQMTSNRPRRPPSLHSAAAGGRSNPFDSTAASAAGVPLQRSSLVPYNTNVFLMEEHEPPQGIRGVPRSSSSRRQRNASYSMDETTANTTTEDEQQQNKKDAKLGGTADDDGTEEEEEEETNADFLSREFSSVYEDARSERLDNMSKAQLVREYLQMEANYNKLSNHLRQRADMIAGPNGSGGRDRELRHRAVALEQQVRDLNSQIYGQ